MENWFADYFNADPRTRSMFRWAIHKIRHNHKMYSIEELEDLWYKERGAKENDLRRMEDAYKMVKLAVKETGDKLESIEKNDMKKINEEEDDFLKKHDGSSRREFINLMDKLKSKTNKSEEDILGTLMADYLDNNGKKILKATEVALGKSDYKEEKDRVENIKQSISDKKKKTKKMPEIESKPEIKKEEPKDKPDRAKLFMTREQCKICGKKLNEDIQTDTNIENGSLDAGRKVCSLCKKSINKLAKNAGCDAGRKAKKIKKNYDLENWELDKK